MDQRQYIAFIGSRNLSQFSNLWISIYCEAVRMAVRWGYGISTGAAVGADQMAAETAVQAAGHVRLVLPWNNYEADWCQALSRSHPEQVETAVYDAAIHAAWRESVKKYHPAAAQLTRGAFLLHARNYGIVAGCAAVIALPSLGDKGGTGQGIRIAQGEGIKLFDLTVEEDRTGLCARLDRGR